MPPSPMTNSPLLDYTPRPAVWAEVPDEQWNDWRWQLKHRLNSVAELEKVVNLTDSERKALSAKNLFRVDITPFFASLIDPDTRDCPVRRQVIPTEEEMAPFESMMEDSLAEDKHSPVPGLVHRYPDRVLMLVTTQCATYCRYCTRSRIVGDPAAQFNRQEFEMQIDYLERTPQVRDVLLSGGDPLILPPKILDYLLGRLRGIPHIEIIRIGSRVPIFLPQRIDDEFCETLAKYHPLWMNLHFNHPKEITPEIKRACDKLSRVGIPLGNQSVLLAGVNDSVKIQRKLVHELVKIRIRPYYLYQCDLVAGAGHLRTTVARGIEIMEGLRGHTSGYAIPTFVVDAPGGGGKIPVAPNYIISQGNGKVVLRNFEGFITTYSEPTDYDPTLIKPLDDQIDDRPEPGQKGVSGLLAGEQLAITPEGFEEVHQRGGAKHRLRSKDDDKWTPHGIGKKDSKPAKMKIHRADDEAKAEAA